VNPVGLTKISVAIVGSPLLQAGILREMVDRGDDLELVLESPLPLERVPREVFASVDVLVIGTDSVDPATMCRLLEDHPGLKAVAIASSARNGRLYELAPNTVVLDPISPSNLAAAVREALDRCHGSDLAAWGTTEPSGRAPEGD
jgi:hypothetical protein